MLAQRLAYSTDGRRRNPANRAEGLRALAKSAARRGRMIDNVLAAAPGLLDGRLSAEAFRTQLAGCEDACDAAPEAGDEAEVAVPQTPSAADNAAYKDYPTRGTPADQGAWAARRDDSERTAAAEEPVAKAKPAIRITAIGLNTAGAMPGGNLVAAPTIVDQHADAIIRPQTARQGPPTPLRRAA